MKYLKKHVCFIMLFIKDHTQKSGKNNPNQKDGNVLYFSFSSKKPFQIFIFIWRVIEIKFIIYRFMDTEQLTTGFSITIHSITFPIKFPCRMNLQYDSKTISTDVEPKSGIFTFNQDLKIKVKYDEDCQIFVYLTTGKSGNILAGTIQLSQSVLQASQGERIATNLQKCMDSTAQCFLSVNHSWRVKEKADIFQVKSIASLSGFQKKNKEKELSYLNRSKKNISFEAPDTQSERIGYLTSIRKEVGSPKSRIPVSPNMVPDKFRFRDNFSPTYDFRQRRQDDFHETRTLGMRQHRQISHISNKQIINETQNSMKMDLMKQKVKFEQLEKTLNDKNNIIKEIKEQLLQNEKKLFQKSYIETQLTSRESTIKNLEERINGIINENMEIKDALAESQKVIVKLKDGKKLDQIHLKSQHEKKEQILKNEVFLQKERITQMEAQISTKSNQLRQAKLFIEQLEKSNKQLLFSNEQKLQQTKSRFIVEEKNLKQINLDYEEEIKKINSKYNEKNQQFINLSNSLNKKDRQYSLLQQKYSKLQNEKMELAVFKSDLSALQKKYALLEQQLKDQQSSHEKNIKIKIKESEQTEEGHKTIISTFQGKISNLSEKNKQLKTKCGQLQNLLVYSKAQEQKLHKNIQKIEKKSEMLQVRISSLESELRQAQEKMKNVEKQSQSRSSNYNHQESLLKVELQHTKESVRNLNQQLTTAEGKILHLQPEVQNLKSEKYRIQNKMHLLEESNQRISDQLVEKKKQCDIKQIQYKQGLKEVNTLLKQREDQVKEKTKEINSWQIRSLNQQNKIQNLENSLKEYSKKEENYEKNIILNLRKQKKELLIQLEQKKQTIKEIKQEQKNTANQKTKLEKENEKNTKIFEIVSQEKNNALGQINKLRDLLLKANKKQEELNSEIRSAIEQNKKMSIKNENLQKENLKTKQAMSQTFVVLENIKSRKSLQYQMSLSPSSSLIRDPSKSKTGFSSQQNDGRDIKMMMQAMQTHIKEQQSMIMALEESNKSYREDLKKSEDELVEVVQAMRMNDDKNAEIMQKMSQEIDSLNERVMALTYEYEERISKTDIQLNKSQKQIIQYKEALNNVVYQLQSTKKKYVSSRQDYAMAQSKLKQQLQELRNEISYETLNISELESAKKDQQRKIIDLQQQIVSFRQEINKRNRGIVDQTNKLNKATKQYDILLNEKKQINAKLLHSKEQNLALRQQVQKRNLTIKEEENNKRQLEEFINTVVKQKEDVVKKELEASGKVFQLQGKIVQLKYKIEGNDEELKKKSEELLSLKDTLREKIQMAKHLEVEVSSQKQKVAELYIKMEEKQKIIIQNGKQKHEIINFNEKNFQNQKAQYQNYKVESEDKLRKLQDIISQQSKKINEQEQLINIQEEKITKMNTQSLQNQQMIFCDKQKISIVQNLLREQKKENSQKQYQIKKMEQEIHRLGEEIGIKEEKIFQYSGGIHQLQVKLNQREAQLTKTMEKMNANWQNKCEQIIEEYEARIEIFEKQKVYLKKKTQQLETEKNLVSSKLIQKEEQSQKQFKVNQDIQKQTQIIKFSQVKERKREIEKYKEQVQRIQTEMRAYKLSMKKLNSQLSIKEDSIHKYQEKIDELEQSRKQLQKDYENHLIITKNKQIGFKKYQEQVKNLNWVIQREIKKVIQIFVQRVMEFFPEGKDKLGQPILRLQEAVGSVLITKS